MSQNSDMLSLSHDIQSWDIKEPTTKIYYNSQKHTQATRTGMI